MVLSIIFIVIAALLVIYGFVNLFVVSAKLGDRLVLWSPACWIFAINFGVAGGFGLANLNIFTGKFGDIEQNLLAFTNLCSSILYGMMLVAGLLAFGAICCILKAIGDAL